MSPFDALADPVRREIVALLAAGERSAGEIVARFDISQPAVSRHLKVLREAGLAEVRADAQRRIYALNPAPLIDLERWLAQQRTIWERRLDRLGVHLDDTAKEEKR